MGLGKVIWLKAGELLVSAPGTGLLGGCHVAAGDARAAPAPSAQTVPATATAVESLVNGRLNIEDLAFVNRTCLRLTAGQGNVTIGHLSRKPGFPVTFLGSG
jgi:hypothetical protein